MRFPFALMGRMDVLTTARDEVSLRTTEQVEAKAIEKSYYSCNNVMTAHIRVTYE